MSKGVDLRSLMGTGLSLVLLSSSAVWAEAAKSAAPANGNATVPAPPPAAAVPANIPAAGTDEAAAARRIATDEARARCTVLLKTITAVANPKDTIEDGACGSLAPVELVSVGKNPEVVLSPPAMLNCEMVVALHDWMKSGVQPLARKHLGSPVVRIETMSSYSCRNAYGRKLAKLSEHGKANALDIGGFVTAKGEAVKVLEDWGLTSGEIRAAALKAEKEQAAREAERAVAKAQVEAQARAVAAAKVTGQTTAASTNPIAGAATLIEGMPKGDLSIGGAVVPRTGPTDLGLTQPNRLGGPKNKPAAAAPGEPAAPPPAANSGNERSFFLRYVHDSACHRFATTLGPEANAAHRNHIHIDLADRHSKSICE